MKMWEEFVYNVFSSACAPRNLGSIPADPVCGLWALFRQFWPGQLSILDFSYLIYLA